MLSRLITLSVGAVARRNFAAAAQEVPKAAQVSTELKLTLASPIKVFYAQSVVKQVDAPGMASDIGLLPIHVPTIAVLKPGVVKVYEEDGKVNKFFVCSGSVSMNPDGSCQVLAEEICSLDEIDEQATRKVIEENQRMMNDTNSSDVTRAEASICIEVAEGALKALSEK